MPATRNGFSRRWERDVHAHAEEYGPVSRAPSTAATMRRAGGSSPQGRKLLGSQATEDHRATEIDHACLLVCPGTARQRPALRGREPRRSPHRPTPTGSESTDLIAEQRTLDPLARRRRSRDRRHRYVRAGSVYLVALQLTANRETQRPSG